MEVGRHMANNNSKEQHKESVTELKQATNDLLSLSDRMFAEGKSIGFIDHDRQLFNVAMALYVKGRKTLESILILCEQGKTEDAMALLRMLFETVLSFLFIFHGDDEERRQKASEYLDFCAVQNLKHRSLLIKEGIDTDKAHIQSTDQLWEQLTEQLGSGKLKQLKGHTNWYSGYFRKNISGMRELTKYLDSKRPGGTPKVYYQQYLTISKCCSGIIHATDIEEHIGFNDNGSLHIKGLASTKWLGTCLAWGSLRFAIVLEKLNEFFKWEYKDDIIKIGRRISEIPPPKLE